MTSIGWPKGGAAGTDRGPGVSDERVATSASPHEVAEPVTPTGRRVLVGLLVATIFLQRFGIPLGGFSLPLILPVGLLCAAYLVLRGDLRPVRIRLVLFVAAVAAFAATSYAAARYSTEVRLTSLGVVLAIWGVWMLRAPGTPVQSRRAFVSTGRAFVRVMTVLSAVGAVQLASQFVGLWNYQDYLRQIVPANLLLPGYNTSIPIEFGSPVHKAQAFVFLEPSHFSQFTAVAIIVAILLGTRLWQVALLALGLVSALSGTGILLLALGIMLLVFRAPRFIRPAYVVAGLACLAVVLVTPASDVLFNRVDELDSQTSSLSLRFIRPYDEVAQGLEEAPQRWVSGAGPGASDRFLESGRERAGQYVVYTVPTKLLFEYGIVAAAVFIGFLVVTVFRDPPSVVLPSLTIAWVFFLGGYLASPHVAWAAWILLPVWSLRE